ncbi:MAG: hypothetical protein ACREPG_05940, partial [Candidatus Binatia bacterium]
MKSGSGAKSAKKQLVPITLMHENYFLVWPGRHMLNRQHMSSWKKPCYRQTGIRCCSKETYINPDTLVRRNAEMLAKGMLDIHAVMKVPRGLKQPGFDRLPEIDDFAKTTRERRLTSMVRAFRQVGSPYILPPGTPVEQVKILRQAFSKTFSDPDFHKEYKKMVGEE